MALAIGGGPCQEHGEKEPPGWPATLRMGRVVRILYALSVVEKKKAGGRVKSLFTECLHPY